MTRTVRKQGAVDRVRYTTGKKSRRPAADPKTRSSQKQRVIEERREFIQETRIKRRWTEPSLDRLPPPEDLEDEPETIGYGEEDYSLTRIESRNFIPPTRQRFIEEGTKLYPGGNVQEVLVARDYLEFTPLNNVHEPSIVWEQFTPRDFVPEPAIRWDLQSSKFLYIAKKEAPFLFLTGVLDPGWELNWDDKWIPTLNRRFQIKVRLPLDPRIYYLKVFRPNRSFKTYRFVQFWIKMPDALKIMIKEANKTTYKR